MHSQTKKLGIITLLGFSSGLPLALSDGTLQVWLASSGIDIETIGLFSLVGLPYILKFLWAPLLDRYRLPFLGRRRGWVAMMQGALLVLLILFFWAKPEINIAFVATLALLVAICSATQDISVDAYRAEILSPQQRGLGAALSVGGYRIALLVSGALAWVIAEQIGFQGAYLLMAALIAACLLVTFFANEPPAVGDTPATLSTAIAKPWVQFFERKGAVALLMLIVLYKLGDAFAGSLTPTFLLRDLGFTLIEIGTIYKAVGLGATLAGAVFGGALMFRIGLYRALLLFAGLQAITNLGFTLLALCGKSYWLMTSVVCLENLSGGMGTAAFVALLMALTDARYTAAQFALLTALASIGRVFAGPVAGYMVASGGWSLYYFETFLIALPAIFLLTRLRAQIEYLDVNTGN